MENLGQSEAAMMVLPQGLTTTTLDDNLSITYSIEQPYYGDASVELELSPTLDTYGRGGIRLGIAVDDKPAEIVSFDLHATGGAQRTPEEKAWANAVINNKYTLKWVAENLTPGTHELTIYRIDDNIVLEKLHIRYSQKTKPDTKSAVSRFFDKLFGDV